MAHPGDESVDPHAAAEQLIAAGGDAATAEDQGNVRQALSAAMVGMKKQFYGKGPTAAKAWVLDDYVIVIMEGGLTRNEETLIADGKATEVRAYRLSFQSTMTNVLCAAVTDIVGRRVLTYDSQVVFDPVRTFELFVLEPEAGAPRP